MGTGSRFPEVELAELAGRVGESDEAWDRLVADQFEYLYGFPRLFRPREDWGEDRLGEWFEYLYLPAADGGPGRLRRALTGYEGRGSFRAYLRRVLQSRFLDWVARPRDPAVRGGPSSDVLEDGLVAALPGQAPVGVPDGEAAHQAVEVRELFDRVREALEGLGVDMRLAVLLPDLVDRVAEADWDALHQRHPDRSREELIEHAVDVCRTSASDQAVADLVFPPGAPEADTAAERRRRLNRLQQLRSRAHRRLRKTLAEVLAGPGVRNHGPDSSEEPGTE